MYRSCLFVFLQVWTSHPRFWLQFLPKLGTSLWPTRTDQFTNNRGPVHEQRHPWISDVTSWDDKANSQNSPLDFRLSSDISDKNINYFVSYADQLSIGDEVLHAALTCKINIVKCLEMFLLPVSAEEETFMCKKLLVHCNVLGMRL